MMTGGNFVAFNSISLCVMGYTMMKKVIKFQKDLVIVIQVNMGQVDQPILLDF